MARTSTNNGKGSDPIPGDDNHNDASRTGIPPHDNTGNNPTSISPHSAPTNNRTGTPIPGDDNHNDANRTGIPPHDNTTGISPHSDPTNNRTGDKIAIPGSYQYNAWHNGSPFQKYWHRFRVTAAMENLHPKPGHHILDAGCGSGMVPALVGQAHPDVQITGIDANPEAIKFCREQWAHLPNVKFVSGTLDNLSQFADNSLDGITFLEVIEHITEKQAANVLSEFHRMLRKGGKLIISTPNRKSIWPALEYIMDLLHLAPKMKADQHEKLYTGSELEALAIQSGLHPISKQKINFIAPWLSPLSQKLAARTHRWETRQKHIPGSLLLYTFTKP